MENRKRWETEHRLKIQIDQELFRTHISLAVKNVPLFGILLSFTSCRGGKCESIFPKRKQTKKLPHQSIK
jgi:hypothetical protein